MCFQAGRSGGEAKAGEGAGRTTSIEPVVFGSYIIPTMRPIVPFVALFASMLTSAASVDGIAIHSTVRGSGPKTIVFVHGWTCDETSWRDQAPFFEKNYRVITLDLPGHGKSGSPAAGLLTMELFAKSIEAIRVEAKAGKIALVGHSMGTPVIREYARLYPSNVAALVPVDGVLHL